MTGIILSLHDNLGDGVAQRRAILHGGRVAARTRFLPFWSLLMAISSGVSKCGIRKGLRVDHFPPLTHPFLAFDSEYLEDGKSQRYISIRA